MAEKPKSPPSKSPTADERRAAALRENLRRRKSQQRLRGVAGKGNKSAADDS